MSEQKEKLLNMEQAIARLSTTRGTFYRWLRSGRISGFKVGRQWRFTEQEIDRFVRGEEPRIELPVSPQELIQTLKTASGASGEEQLVDSPADPITQVVNLIIVCALGKGAETLHVDIVDQSETDGPVGRYSLRIDGLNHTIASYDARLQPAITDRLKQLCGMDLNERRLPQDGRMKLKISANRAIDITGCIAPAMLGECWTGRIVDPAAARMDFEPLGLAEQNRKRVEAALNARQGLFVASGPSDSGKTVTAYSMMNSVATDEHRLMTIEDLVLVALPGVVQCVTNKRLGMGVAELIRMAPRQNPDILYVGFISDQVELLAALNMALSMRVITSMHFRDAVSGLVTMRDWGAKGLLLGDAIGAITNQRLVRKLCGHCRKPEVVSAEDQALIDGVVAYHGSQALTGQFYTSTGCDHCHDGYLGRVALFEVLVPSSNLERALVEGVGYDGLHRIAVDEGMETVCLDGLRKASEGITSLREVRRVAYDLLDAY